MKTNDKDAPGGCDCIVIGLVVFGALVIDSCMAAGAACILAALVIQEIGIRRRAK